MYDEPTLTKDHLAKLQSHLDFYSRSDGLLADHKDFMTDKKADGNTHSISIAGTEEQVTQPAWGAIFALAFGAALLAAVHLLPVGLLTPLAAELQISDGQAGQTLTATSAIAFLTSLVVVIAARNLDRRILFLVLAIVQAVSSLLVAIAPNFVLLLLGRMLLGIALGGVWSLCPSMAMRLVPPRLVPRALSIIFGAGTLASVVAVPIGSYLGSVFGWRTIFLGAVALAVLALAWQFLAVPSLPARGPTRLAAMVHLLRRPQVRLGMMGDLLFFAGHFACFTYLRPILETVTHVGVREFSLIQIGSGIASFVGTFLAAMLLARNLRLTLILMMLMMSVFAAGLVVFGNDLLVTATLVALWGFAFSIVPIGWSTWITRTVPDEAESGGGLLMATTQLAITLGAAVGGITIDRSGAIGAVVVSGMVLLLASLITTLALRIQLALPQMRLKKEMY